MRIAIIASSADPASVNIHTQLLSLYSFEKVSETIHRFEKDETTVDLHLTDQSILACEEYLANVECEVFLFVSVHRSKENTPSFMVHSIGNWNDNPSGGKKGVLCPVRASLYKDLYHALVEETAKREGYIASIEATHHGPYTEKPTLFLEIGSTEQEWTDAENGNVIAHTIMKGVFEKSSVASVAVGLGGQHYPRTFMKLMERKNFAFSHICPKFSLEYLNKELILDAVQKTEEKVDMIVLDWKGLGQHKQHVISLLEELQLPYERSDRLLKS